MRRRRATAPRSPVQMPAVTTTADMIARLASAARRLETIDSEIARLTGEKQQTEAEIRGIAHEVVAGDTDTAKSASGAKGHVSNGSVAKPLAPRYRKLLALLGTNPDADYELLCNAIYQRVDRSARINVSSAFSHLKADGYVEAIGPGHFSLTDKGKQAIQQP